MATPAGVFRPNHAGYVDDMGDTSIDPIDHQRTALRHAGEEMKNTLAMPGLIAIFISTAVIFASLYAFAVGAVAAGLVTALVAVLLLSGGFAWLDHERRRVKRIDLQYSTVHHAS